MNKHNIQPKDLINYISLLEFDDKQDKIAKWKNSINLPIPSKSQLISDENDSGIHDSVPEAYDYMPSTKGLFPEPEEEKKDPEKPPEPKPPNLSSLTSTKLSPNSNESTPLQTNPNTPAHTGNQTPILGNKTPKPDNPFLPTIKEEIKKENADLFDPTSSSEDEEIDTTEIKLETPIKNAVAASTLPSQGSITSQFLKTTEKFVKKMIIQL